MKAHKINLEDYEVEVPTRDESGQEKTVKIPYRVKQSFEAVIFNPALKLDGRQVILQNKVFEKIEKAEKEVLLDSDDYLKTKQAFERFEGFRKADLILVKRVLEAEEVEVEEAKKK